MPFFHFEFDGFVASAEVSALFGLLYFACVFGFFLFEEHGYGECDAFDVG